MSLVSGDINDSKTLSGSKCFDEDETCEGLNLSATNRISVDCTAC